MNQSFTTIDAINLGIAIFGATVALFSATLGLLNTWRLFDRDRVKLRVVGSHAFGVGAASGFNGYTIDVLNLSSFPVTISQVGFTVRGRKERLVILRPRMADNGPFPRVLEPRTGVCILVDPTDFGGADTKTLTHVYAKTTCGVTQKRSAANLFAKD